MNHIGNKSIFYIDSQKKTSGTSGQFSISANMPPTNTCNRMTLIDVKAPLIKTLDDARLKPIGKYTVDLVGNII